MTPGRRTPVAVRAARRARRRWNVVRLGLLNRFSRRAVVGRADCVVSLTTFGARTRTAHLAVESVARGTVRPRRAILWVDDPAVADRPPRPLRRLRRRGLEIRLCEDLGPHKKYYPYAVDATRDPDLALVTADDDVVYPRDWLAGLLRAHDRSPGAVVCYRAHRILLSDTGILPYTTWPPCPDRRPSVLNFATGVSGVLHPPRMLDAARRAGPAFRDRAPTADDVWLHHLAVREGLEVRQVDDAPRHFDVLPGTQEVGLMADNVGRSGNDRQIRATYDDRVLARLREVAGRTVSGSPPSPSGAAT